MVKAQFLFIYFISNLLWTSTFIKYDEDKSLITWLDVAAVLSTVKFLNVYFHLFTYLFMDWEKNNLWTSVQPTVGILLI